MQDEKAKESEAGFTGDLQIGSLNCDFYDLLIFVICGIASGTRSYRRSGRRTENAGGAYYFVSISEILR